MPVNIVVPDQVNWNNGHPAHAQPQNNRGRGRGRGGGQASRGAPANRGKTTTRGGGIVRGGQTGRGGRGGHGRGGHHFVGPDGYVCRAVQRRPDLSLLPIGGVVAFDCEGVTLWHERGENRNGLGRFSAVNENGQVIYDTFAYYPKGSGARPPPAWRKLGVYSEDILAMNGAQRYADVIKCVTDIFEQAGVIVAHAARNDMKMLKGVPFERFLGKIRDTQRYPPINVHAKENVVSLEDAAREELGIQIQRDEHSSVEDAQATMKLYLLHREGIEAFYRPSLPTSERETNGMDADADDEPEVDPLASTSVGDLEETPAPTAETVEPAPVSEDHTADLTNGTTNNATAEIPNGSSSTAVPESNAPRGRRNRGKGKQRKDSARGGSGVGGRHVPGAD